MLIKNPEEERTLCNLLVLSSHADMASWKEQLGSALSSDPKASPGMGQGGSGSHPGS